MIARFYDSTGGGFFDTEASNDAPLGALSARRKPLQDTPTPAGNPAAAAALLRLEASELAFLDRLELELSRMRADLAAAHVAGSG